MYAPIRAFGFGYVSVADYGQSVSLGMLELSANVITLDRVLALMEQSTQPLAVTSQSRGGLILVNHHYSDLIGPGSRFNLAPDTFTVKDYAVGTVELCEFRHLRPGNGLCTIGIMGLSILSRILARLWTRFAGPVLLVNLAVSALGAGYGENRPI